MATTSGVVLPVNQAYAIRGASGWRRYLELPQSQTPICTDSEIRSPLSCYQQECPWSVLCSARHSSVKVTEKHYAPWVLDRQQQLEEDVRRTWTKGTLEVRGGKALV